MSYIHVVHYMRSCKSKVKFNRSILTYLGENLVSHKGQQFSSGQLAFWFVCSSRSVCVQFGVLRSASDSRRSRLVEGCTLPPTPARLAADCRLTVVGSCVLILSPLAWVPLSTQVHRSSSGCFKTAELLSCFICRISPALRLEREFTAFTNVRLVVGKSSSRNDSEKRSASVRNSSAKSLVRKWSFFWRTHLRQAEGRDDHSSRLASDSFCDFSTVSFRYKSEVCKVSFYVILSELFNKIIIHFLLLNSKVRQ